MPEAADLRRVEVDGQVVVSVGARVVSSFPVGDSVMRNIAAVTLTELGFTGQRVGAVLGITEQYVSMLRGRVRLEGSAGLIRSQGRPPALGVGQRERARRWRAEGLSDTAIAVRLGVHAMLLVGAGEVPALADWAAHGRTAGWSVIRPGDIILAAGTRLPWIIASVSGAEITAVRGAATHRATPDPAAAVDVLVPLVERNALGAARDGLGAQLVDRSGPR